MSREVPSERKTFTRNDIDKLLVLITVFAKGIGTIDNGVVYATYNVTTTYILFFFPEAVVHL